MVVADNTAVVYDAALHRRQALMGSSGPMALVKNARVFAIAAFACIGGVLYGYNVRTDYEILIYTGKR